MIAKRRMLFIVVMAVLLSAALVFAAGDKSFKAKLMGKYEAQPTKSEATGMVHLTFSSDGKQMMYKLTVKNIMNVTAAHIHTGSMGKSGPVVAGLFSGPKKEGTFSGTLAEGILTDKDLNGSLSGKSLDDLVKMIETGEVYVNVHTDQNPAGEIRGQLK